MDVNVTLAAMRLACSALMSLPEDSDDYRHFASGLAELTTALDGWISSGGFLPNDWQGK